ncbi:aldehyde dehydrogenase family protein [Micromonospora chalcea]
MVEASSAAARREHLRSEVVPGIDVRPYINGVHCDPHSDLLLDVMDPSTGNVIARIPAADTRDVSGAVQAARLAFDEGPWPRMHPRERAACLVRLAELIEANQAELALLESSDVGKRIGSTRGWDIPNAPEVYRYYAGWADKVDGHTLPDVWGARAQTYREPVGVVAAIMPWNFPFACLAWKLAPALAAGCTVVVKAAERAPLSTHAITRYFNEAGFPPGVVNVILGEGETAGRQLVRDPRVNKISFTGDLATARDIIPGTAENIARLSLELGGKSANVVMGDADLTAAATGAVAAMYSVSGQDCGAGSRLFVHSSVFDEFTSELKRLIDARVLGDALADTTEQGPQIDQAHVQRIAGYVSKAVSEGAEVLVGGDVASDVGPLFFQPTLLTGVADDASVYREEVFGPVGVINRFDTLEEAIRRANDSHYGLAGAIWTKTTADSERFVREIQAGAVWVNCYGYFDPSAPWGGRKQSGYGRELGREGIDAFLETKAVYRL